MYASDGYRKTGCLTLNAWNHIAVTSDGSSWKLYANGVLLTGLTDLGAPAKVDGYWFNVPSGIGGNEYCLGALVRYNGTDIRNYFNGEIAEFYIWDTALDADAIAALYDDNFVYGHTGYLTFHDSGSADIDCSDGYGLTLDQAAETITYGIGRYQYDGSNVGGFTPTYNDFQTLTELQNDSDQLKRYYKFQVELTSSAGMNPVFALFSSVTYAMDSSPPTLPTNPVACKVEHGTVYNVAIDMVTGQEQGISGYGQLTVEYESSVTPDTWYYRKATDGTWAINPGSLGAADHWVWDGDAELVPLIVALNRLSANVSRVRLSSWDVAGNTQSTLANIDLLDFPETENVNTLDTVRGVTGTNVNPAISDVLVDVIYGPGSSLTGTRVCGTAQVVTLAIDENLIATIGGTLEAQAVHLLAKKDSRWHSVGWRVGDGDITIPSSQLMEGTYTARAIAYSSPGAVSDLAAFTVAADTIAHQVGDNWIRWINASINKHFNTHKDSDLPLYTEGNIRDLTQQRSNQKYFDLRVDGPYYTQTDKGYWDIYIEINALLTVPYNNKDLYQIHKVTDHVASLFANSIPTYRLGSGAYDDQTLFGCLTRKSGYREKLQVSMLGTPPNGEVLQSVVEGHYSMTVAEE